MCINLLGLFGCLKKRLKACYSQKGLWFKQRLIISLKFVNSKCDNFRFFIVRGQITIVIKKMKAFGKL